MAIVDPGDEVIVAEAVYENYGPDAVLCDANRLYVPLQPGEPLDLTAWPAPFAPDRAIIVNTPNKSDRRVFTADSRASRVCGTPNPPRTPLNNDPIAHRFPHKISQL
jgi:hypothetical protein